jgi:hypothetical protein
MLKVQKQKNTLLKSIASVILAILVLQPTMALAQLESVPISHPGLGSGGIIGSSAALASKTALEAIVTSNEVCQKAEETYDGGNKVKGIAYGGLSLIGGSQTEVADLEAYKVALDRFIECREGVRTSLKAVVVSNLYDGQTKQRLSDEINLVIQNLKKRRDDIETQAKIAKRGLWKGILAAMLIKTTKTVAQRLVNTITSKYKINDVLKYADAIASNVYTAQLIQDRAVDGQEQLILRSIITNPLLRSKVDSAIYQRAADALELNGSTFTASSISADDPDFYLKLGKFGDPQTNPAFMKTVYENRASEINSVSLSSAQNEILLGSGLKAPRNCSGNVNEQKAIDQKWAQTNDQLKNRLDLYNDLKNAYATKYDKLSSSEQKKLSDDLKKAENDYITASRQLKAMPTSYKSPVLKICEAIASPAELVNKGIDKSFSAFSKGMSDYNDNNLPFFMTWVSDIGANIANNLIFGGDVKSAFLSESSNLAQAVNYGLSFVDAQSARKNLENGINFGYEPGNGKDEYILSWEMVSVERADYVTINGDGISDVKRDSAGRVITETTRIGNATVTVPAVNKLAKDGSVAIKTSRGGEYSLKVYDKNNVLLTNRASITITPQSTQASASTGTNGTGGGSSGGTGGSASGGSGTVCGGNYASLTACMADTGDQAYCNNLCGQVRGASINVMSESFRGTPEKLR